MPDLSESDIRAGASAESFRRGFELYEAAAVDSLVQRGDLLVAHVFGSQGNLYEVQVLLAEDGVASAVCSCPYDWGGWCKHIVAALLATITIPMRLKGDRPWPNNWRLSIVSNCWI